MTEHPKITAARVALADAQARAEQRMAALYAILARVPSIGAYWEHAAKCMRVRRAWKAAVNRKANALDRAIRVYG